MADFEFINQSNKDAWIVYQRWQNVDANYPEGYRTKGWYKIKAGQSRSFPGPKITERNDLDIVAELMELEDKDEDGSIPGLDWVWIYVTHPYPSEIRPVDHEDRHSFPSWIHPTKGFTVVEEWDADTPRWYVKDRIHSNRPQNQLVQKDFYRYQYFDGGSLTLLANGTLEPSDLIEFDGDDFGPGPDEVHGPDEAFHVHIPDPNLRAEIEKKLGKPSGTTISKVDMLTLTSLNASAADIQDLTGLEFATNLTELDIGQGQISEDEFHSNQISDISPLAGLTNLTRLYLGDNEISDVSPLSGLTNLTKLELWENEISDVSPLSGLTNLTGLDLGGNEISDVSPLSGLTNLTGLDLWNNEISDFSPIAGLIPNLTDYYDNSNQRVAKTPAVDLNAPVTIPDPNLRRAIENRLGKASGTTITQADMLKLTWLLVREAAIEDLTGLEFATNLITLDLFLNKISDVSPLRGLTNLEKLGLSYNEISDVSPLKNLINLKALYLGSNEISDVSPLRGLTNLEKLWLSYTQMSDVSPLRGLTNLKELWLSYNEISDVSPLRGLTNLEGLWIRDNEISDISPIATLKNLTRLDLRDNEISDVSPLRGLTNLTELSLGRNEISDVSPLRGLTNLTELSLRFNKISDVSALRGLTNLTELHLSNNQISDFSPIAGLIPNLTTYQNDNQDATKAPVTIRDPNLRKAIEKSIAIEEARGKSGKRVLTPLESRTIEEALGKNPGATITQADMLTLTSFEARDAGVEDLSGLEFATNLTALWLNGNNISDISPLAKLKNLRVLKCPVNNISDISPLAKLKNLADLWLNDNNISDISPLAKLKNLTYLRLDANNISDVSPLAALPKLADVYLAGNMISDFSPLAGIFPTLSGRSGLYGKDDQRTDWATATEPNAVVNIPDPVLRYILESEIQRSRSTSGLQTRRNIPITQGDLAKLTSLGGGGLDQHLQDLTGLEFAINLQRLALSSDELSNISPLAGLKSLRTLRLEEGKISDVSPLKNLINLESLHLDHNDIVDVSPLKNLINLTELNLWHNAISDVSPLKNLINLTELNLWHNAISDISTLKNLIHLESLDLAHNDIVDISALKNLIHLKSLGLSGNAISDISALKNLIHLKSLGLSGNAISDISALKNLIHLERLEFNSNRVSDISALKNLIHLESLDLAHNDIVDISALKNLIHLDILELNSNRVSDISALKNLINLKALDLKDNYITDFSPIAEVRPNLTLYEFGIQRHGCSTQMPPDLDPLKPVRIIPQIERTIMSTETGASYATTKAAVASEGGENRLWTPAETVASSEEEKYSLVLTVEFLDGWNFKDERLKVERAAKEWARWGNILFKFVSSGKSDIRVRFDDEKKGKWSSDIGAPKGWHDLEPYWNSDDHTMYLTTDVTFKIALHEFGHALGLTHEHLNPEFAKHFAWKFSGDELYYKISERFGSYQTPPTKEDKERIDHNILKLQEVDEVESYFDIESVMTYGLSDSLIEIRPTADQRVKEIFALKEGIPHNGRFSSLSDGDKKFMAACYGDPIARAKISGQVHVKGVDDEIFSDDTINQTKPIPAHIVGHHHLFHGRKDKAMSFKWGGECRVEVYLLTRTIENNEVEVGVAALLYEGTSEDTDDLEDIKCKSFKVPLGGNGFVFFRLKNEGWGGTEIDARVISCTDLDISFKDGGIRGDLLGGGGDWAHVSVTVNAASVSTTLAPAAPSMIVAGHPSASETADRFLSSDVNSDGRVDTADLVLVSNYIGHSAPETPPVDINGDGIVTIADLVHVAQYLGQSSGVYLGSSTYAAAPSVVVPPALQYSTVAGWIDQARVEDDGSLVFHQGIAKLEYLLTLIIPEKTALLHNYPNPFNPETWIPYHLAEPADVALTIYAVDGKVVRRLDLGHQAAGYYQNKSRAAYWDGRNNVGERVASGLYFYTLTAGDFAATRKMLIRK